MAYSPEEALLGIGSLVLIYWLIRLPIEWFDWKRKLTKGAVWPKGCEPSFSDVLFNGGIRSRPFEQFAIDETDRLMRKSPRSYGLSDDFFTKKDALAQHGEEAPRPAAAPKDREYEDFRDPAGKSIREFFEVGAFWAIFWSAAYELWFLVEKSLEWILPARDLQWLVFILSVVVTLGIGVAVLASGDGESGKFRARNVRRLASRYAFPITLAAGVVIGWQWREHKPSDFDESAKSVAWHACGEMPDCIRRAEELNGGGPVGYFIRPKT